MKRRKQKRTKEKNTERKDRRNGFKRKYENRI